MKLLKDLAKSVFYGTIAIVVIAGVLFVVYGGIRLLSSVYDTVYHYTENGLLSHGIAAALIVFLAVATFGFAIERGWIQDGD